MALRLPRPSPKFWLGLILLVLGGLLTLVEQRGTSPPRPAPSSASGEPDYYLEGVRLTRYDAKGRPHQRLETPRLAHTPGDDMTRAETPVGRLLDAEGRVWFVSGDKGTLGAGGNPLTLTGNAVLKSPQEGWRLDTEILVYDADERHAWSKSPALLRQHQQRVRGERFDAWIDEGRMRLTDNVHGFHPPLNEGQGS